jgi:hypothetical protein
VPTGVKLLKGVPETFDGGLPDCTFNEAMLLDTPLSGLPVRRRYTALSRTSLSLTIRTVNWDEVGVNVVSAQPLDATEDAEGLVPKHPASATNADRATTLAKYRFRLLPVTKAPHHQFGDTT